MYSSLVWCARSLIFVQKALFSPHLWWYSHGLVFTSSQACLSDQGQRRALCRSVVQDMKIYKESLEGMGVSILARCYGLPAVASFAPPCRDKVLMSLKINRQLIEKWRAEGVVLSPIVWEVYVQYSSYSASFSLASPGARLHSFMRVGYVWSCPTLSGIILSSYL